MTLNNLLLDSYGARIITQKISITKLFQLLCQAGIIIWVLRGESCPGEKKHSIPHLYHPIKSEEANFNLLYSDSSLQRKAEFPDIFQAMTQCTLLNSVGYIKIWPRKTHPLVQQ